MISKFHNDPNFRWWNVFQTSSFILFSKLSCVEFEIMCNKSSDWNDLWVGNSAKIIMSNKKILYCRIVSWSHYYWRSICWKLLPGLKNLCFFGMSNFQCGHHLAVRVLGWRCCSDLWFGCTSHVSCVQHPKCRSMNNILVKHSSFD
jgi:hypothetical protein